MPARSRTGELFPHIAGTKLSDEQKAFVDAARGSLSVSAYLRLLVVQEKRRRSMDTP